MEKIKKIVSRHLFFFFLQIYIYNISQPIRFQEYSIQLKDIFLLCFFSAHGIVEDEVFLCRKRTQHDRI